MSLVGHTHEKCGRRPMIGQPVPCSTATMSSEEQKVPQPRVSTLEVGLRDLKKLSYE